MSSQNNNKSNQKRRFYNKNRNNSGESGSNNKPSSKKSQINKELKFHLHGVGKEKQTTTYSKVLEKICLRIQQSYNSGSRVARSLMEDKVIPLPEPEREESQETDPTKKVFDQRTKDMLWDKKLELWVQQESEFNENWSKAYAFIFEQYCGKEMQVTIKELEHFELKIQNDPLELLKEIRTLIHTPIKAGYLFMTLTENLATFLNLRQAENESLLDYLERFEQEKNIIKSMLGTQILDKFTETYPGYDDMSSDEQNTMKDATWDAWMATIFLRGGDMKAYGELLKDYWKDFANKRDSYPKMVRQSLDVMRQLKPHKKPKESSGKGKQSGSSTKNGSFENSTKKESSFN